MDEAEDVVVDVEEAEEEVVEEVVEEEEEDVDEVSPISTIVRFFIFSFFNTQSKTHRWTGR